MKKTSCFYIDDVIWCFRDIARQKPKSIYDNDFFKMLKHAHDETGMTVQLNLFFRTDFFYGSDEFTLSEMPSCYKKEFEEASDWLKFSFHSKQEFPDYPYINAKYADVKKDYTELIDEVHRFAGEKSISRSVLTHWISISREACLAFADSGVKSISVNGGETREYTCNQDILSYTHVSRLLYNRQPETKLLYTYTPSADKTIISICGYNCVTNEEYVDLLSKNKSILDEKSGLRFRRLGSRIDLVNFKNIESLKATLEQHIESEYLGISLHEQYFYPYYRAYQPDYADKLYFATNMLKDAGYKFVNADDLK